MPNIIDISCIHTTEDLQTGDILQVDLAGNHALIIIGHDNIIQAQLWEINGSFLYGYQIEYLYHVSTTAISNFYLSPDGIILYYYGKGGPIISLQDDTDDHMSVNIYKTPTAVTKFRYTRPERSSYRCIYQKNGKVIVASDSGDKITVLDFSEEYADYRAQKTSDDFPLVIGYIVLASAILIGTVLCSNNAIKQQVFTKSGKYFFRKHS